MRWGLALLAVAAASLPGLTRAEDDPACARFEDPLAYNACLASRGPKAKDIGSSPGSASAQRPDPEGEESLAASKRAHRAQRIAPRHGRIHMEFWVR